MFCSCRISTDKRVARSLCHSRASCAYMIVLNFIREHQLQIAAVLLLSLGVMRPAAADHRRYPPTRLPTKSQHAVISIRQNANVINSNGTSCLLVRQYYSVRLAAFHNQQLHSLLVAGSFDLPPLKIEHC